MTRSKIDNEVRVFGVTDLVTVLVEHLVFMKRDSSEGEVQTSMGPCAFKLTEAEGLVWMERDESEILYKYNGRYNNHRTSTGTAVV